MAPAVRPLGSLSMARGCARIDSRPDTAKIASADRVGVHHARLLGAKGKPQWAKPKPFRWDYAQFGKTDTAPAKPDEAMEFTIVKHNGALNGFNQWTLNGEAFSMETMKPVYKVHEGRRYRLKFRNASDDIHPLHLHRHSFELARIGGKPTVGVLKDVIMLGGFQEIEFDFVADNPGMTLFHCHQQLHMDFGFMALFDYA